MTGRKNNRKRLAPGKNSRNKSKKKDKDINALAISDSIEGCKGDRFHVSERRKACDEICERISCGESLVKICRDAHIPDKATIFRWLIKSGQPNADEDLIIFRDNYAHAREAQADALVDEMIDIADGTDQIDPKLEVNKMMRGAMARGDPSAKGFVDVRHIKTRIWARQWVAARQRPKKYGDKLELSGDEKNPLSHKNVELTSDELNKELVKRGLPTVILEK